MVKNTMYLFEVFYGINLYFFSLRIFTYLHTFSTSFVVKLFLQIKSDYKVCQIYIVAFPISGLVIRKTILLNF